MSYIKYYVYKKQQKVNGQWVDVYPSETKPDGNPLGTYDTLAECEGTEPQYRWVNLNPAVDYYCNGTTKYYKQQKQISTDGGQTWSNVVPAEYQQGSVAEFESSDCGYVPPTPTGTTKFRATYTGGTTYEVECNSTSALTTVDTKPNGYTASAMTSAEIGSCVTSIGDNVFAYCTSLPSITIPDSVTTIGYSAFTNCYSLTTCTIGSGITTIKQRTFYHCNSLTSITIPNNVTSIDWGAFSLCSGITTCTLGSGLTKIESYAFRKCYSLPSITIPDSVTTIGNNAFDECSGLTTCTIGSGVTSIGDEAFMDCSSLQSITCLASSPPQLPINGSLSTGRHFYNTNNCPIYVPQGSLSAYLSSSWSKYSSRLQAIP